MIERAYYSSPVPAFLTEDAQKILGILTLHHGFTLEEKQRDAWLKEIEILKESLSLLTQGYILLEYSIPRMGKRVDTVLLMNGLVFVIEFKVDELNYHLAALDQVMDYALDLKNFHEASHGLPIIPLLVATRASPTQNEYEPFEDWVYRPLKANAKNLRETLENALRLIPGVAIDAQSWIDSAYKPAPTIIEAAQALYEGHNVKEISRSEAGATNLTKTSDAIREIIHQAKLHRQKAICFVTGVPGSGKTLVGLNIASSRFEGEDERAVFLSGNGPLVEVLREALARDALHAAKERAENQTPNTASVIEKRRNLTKKDALRKSGEFIQNIHHFRDEALMAPDKAPFERVVIFDEAQRAWTRKQTADFMKRKRGLSDFDKSEPEFLISVMDRHQDWAVIICLVGGGQEINTGEAGLGEWFSAVRSSFPAWNVYVSDKITDVEYTQNQKRYRFLLLRQVKYVTELHLGVSIRSFRSEKISDLVKSVLDLDLARSQEIYNGVRAVYPIALTRDLASAKAWVKKKARGTERTGLLANSGAMRLRPTGIDVKSDIEVEKWFLKDKADVRSSFALEQAATEFDIQGLELDWTIVAWDADLRLKQGVWSYHNFSGSRWQIVKDEQRRVFLKNAYRVLLTRARQGMIIFVPRGEQDDATRIPSFYNEVFEYLRQIGLEVI